MFDENGGSLQRLVTGGQLAAPWGIALAPAGFGQFGGDLLVGNFSFVASEINAFDPVTGAFQGTIPIDVGIGNTPGGLWALIFGSGAGNGGDANTLYFNDGINGELNGLFAALQVPEPSSMALLGVPSLCLACDASGGAGTLERVTADPLSARSPGAAPGIAPRKRGRDVSDAGSAVACRLVLLKYHGADRPLARHNLRPGQAEAGAIGLSGNTVLAFMISRYPHQPPGIVLWSDMGRWLAPGSSAIGSHSTDRAARRCRSKLRRCAWPGSAKTSATG